jgi:hypothetical protein
MSLKEDNIIQTKLIGKHGASGVSMQKQRSSIKKADADARPPPSIGTSTAQLGTSNTPIIVDVLALTLCKETVQA